MEGPKIIQAKKSRSAKMNGSLVQSGPPKGGVGFSMCEASSEKGVG